MMLTSLSSASAVSILYTVEALARGGIGTFDLIDDDDVAITNLNRQIIATTETIGKPKVQVMAERIYSINPDAVVNIHQCFFLPENQEQFDFTQYDYVVDAVDTVGKNCYYYGSQRSTYTCYQQAWVQEIR